LRTAEQRAITSLSGDDFREFVTPDPDDETVPLGDALQLGT
jgi:hypothetical protein